MRGKFRRWTCRLQQATLPRINSSHLPGGLFKRNSSSKPIVSGAMLVAGRVMEKRLTYWKTPFFCTNNLWFFTQIHFEGVEPVGFPYPVGQTGPTIHIGTVARREGAIDFSIEIFSVREWMDQNFWDSIFLIDFGNFRDFLGFFLLPSWFYSWKGNRGGVWNVSWFCEKKAGTTDGRAHSFL